MSLSGLCFFLCLFFPLALPSSLSTILLTSRTRSNQHSSTLTLVLADVSRKGHPKALARSCPSAVVTCLLSSISHLFPTRTTGILSEKSLSLTCLRQRKHEERGVRVDNGRYRNEGRDINWLDISYILSKKEIFGKGYLIYLITESNYLIKTVSWCDIVDNQKPFPSSHILKVRRRKGRERLLILAKSIKMNSTINNSWIYTWSLMAAVLPNYNGTGKEKERKRMDDYNRVHTNKIL